MQLAFEEVLGISQTRSGLWSKIDASVSLGFSFVQATDVTQSSLDADFTRRNRRFSSSVDLLSVVSDTADESFSRNDLSYTILRHLPGRWTYDVSAQRQTNESLGLDRRVLLTASALHRTLSNNLREVYLGAGIAASKEEFTDDQPSGTNFEVTLSLRNFAFRFEDPELEVAFSLVVYQGLTTSGRTRAELSSSAKRELVSDLFWSLNRYWTYDSDPVALDADQSDLTVTASLGWKF